MKRNNEDQALMATSRQVRVLALQALYALDASDGRDPEGVKATLLADGAGFDADDRPANGGVRNATPKQIAVEFTPAERTRAFESAHAAWTAREQADEFFAALAPTWPANRQPIVDRSILRLSWHELKAGKTPPRVVVDEAIEMAKEFSTEKSPAFINALLDKAMKSLGETGWAGDDTDDVDDSHDTGDQRGTGEGSGPMNTGGREA